MAKPISGTKDLKKFEVLKGQKDIRQMRCRKCLHGMATQQPDGKGGFLYRCGGCAAEYQFTHI